MNLERLSEVQKFIIEHVEANPSTISRVAQEAFGISRQAVARHLTALKKLGLLKQHGERNKAVYTLAVKAKNQKIKERPDTSEKLVKSGQKVEKKFEVKVGSQDEDVIWKTIVRPNIGLLSDNVMDICKYGFTEMFNNVIDHSESKDAQIRIEYNDRDVQLTIQDFGIGAFRKISQFLRIQDLRDAVVRLHQGKVTTDEKNHTGQGIFFTSRAFDRFSLASNGFLYIKDNSKEDDWYFESQKDENVPGTQVRMRISKSSPRILKQVFDLYTNDEFSFDKSHIRIELGKYDEDSYVSRSQAKRLLAGLANFRTIILDFKNIKNVGQGFVDEVFGVFGLEHPEVHFEISNANEDILFMVRKGLRDRKIPLESVFIHR